MMILSNSQTARATHIGAYRIARSINLRRLSVVRSVNSCTFSRRVIERPATRRPRVLEWNTRHRGALREKDDRFN